MRLTLTLLFPFFSILARSQDVPFSFPKPDSNFQFKVKTVLPQLRTTEECNNGIDDDGNGLKDCEDYSCYFNNSSCNCVPSNTVWIATSQAKLYWANVQTSQEAYVGTLAIGMNDITWTPDGKLYGIGGVGVSIYEINPATAQITFRASVPGYNGCNAMTCDEQGNLYIAALITGSGYRIIKYNLTTGQQTIIANLAAVNLQSGGDLAFLNGALYCACNANTIAKIDINTGVVQALPIQGIPSNTTIYGIVSTADGSLFLSSVFSLYKLNPNTMQAVLAYNCSSFNAIIYGMSNFNDNCNATPCPARVTIDATTNPPYCIGQGALLQATGTGLTGNAVYKWQLPDGSVVTGQSVNALQNGKYKVSYSEDPACIARDSITITLEGPPALNLGKDSAVCPGGSLVLQNYAAGTGSYLWHNGSTQNATSVNASGTYWLQLTGACGVSRDSIVVQSGQLPVANLGPDIMICPYDETLLKNSVNDPAYAYLWSTGGSSNSLLVLQPSTYWINVTNSCGTVRDTVVVGKKPSECDCFLYVPTAFTPNGDGKNDEFRVNSNCRILGELLIYNRWGQVVYKTKDLSQGWNGRISSQLQPGAVYVYLLKYRFRNYPDQLQEKGSFILIH